MLINCSNYLEDKIDGLQSLIELLLEYFDDASILATDVIGKSMSASKYETTIKDHYLAERGFVARVIKGGNLFEYSFNHWEEISTLKDSILKKFKEHSAMVDKLELAYYDKAVVNKEIAFETDVREVKIGINEVSLEDIILQLKSMNLYAMSLSNEIIDFKCSFNYLITSKVFVSPTKTLKQAYMASDVSGFVIARNDQNRNVSYHESIGELMGVEILDAFEDRIPEIIMATLELFNAKKVTPGIYDVICDPKVSGLIAHEAFGHGVEMDMFVKNRALAKSFINKKVASDVVTMRDGVSCVNQVASYLFDDEGIIAKETTIIADGILKEGISDYVSANRLGVKPSGNGRRESFERKVYTRMTNTYFEKGNDSLKNMISSIRYGFLLEGMISGMEDPKHWGIQCMIAKGREIVDGHFTGVIIAPVILTGYVPRLLQDISMVGDETFLQVGSCGKGYKETVRVSCGGPYIKTKARLG